MADRPGLKTSVEIHGEVNNLASDYGIAIGDFTDILLEFVTGDIARVEAAIDDRKTRGSVKARKRRG